MYFTFENAFSRRWVQPNADSYLYADGFHGAHLLPRRHLWNPANSSFDMCLLACPYFADQALPVKVRGKTLGCAIRWVLK